MTKSNLPSLRDRLRKETGEAHARVDALFGSADFATPQGYVRFLVGQAVAWETLRPLLDSASLARSDALRADLARLDGRRPAPMRSAGLPERLSIGHRYVLEGSRLGSTLLGRLLAEKSPELAERAGAYLAESARIEPWKQLSVTLQNSPADHDSGDTAVADARAMFGLFERAWHASASLEMSGNSIS